MMESLGILDAKTLHRRREGYNDPKMHPDAQFLKPGIHFIRKSPNSRNFVWDPEATNRAWLEAIRVAEAFWAQEEA